jgi:hypothetical protein
LRNIKVLFRLKRLQYSYVENGASRIGIFDFLNRELNMNSDLEKWEKLMLGLDINLRSFWGPHLICPIKVSTLVDQVLKDFAKDMGIDDFCQTISILDQEDIVAFESVFGKKMPVEYRNFLKVFGTGTFGVDGVSIHDFQLSDIEGQLRANAGILENHVSDYKRAMKWSNEFQDLIDNCYLFGFGEVDISFVFDLRTWDEKDQSYDIYGVEHANSFCYYRVGRDFFDFIQECCINDNLKDKGRFPGFTASWEDEICDDVDEILARSTTTFSPGRKWLPEDKN